MPYNTVYFFEFFIFLGIKKMREKPDNNLIPSKYFILHCLQNADRKNDV